MSERPNAGTEETVERRDPSELEGRSRKKKVHSLIDKVFSRKNLELAWEKVKRNRGSAGIDAVTVAEFEEGKGYFLDLLHRKLREETCRTQPVKRVEIPKPDGGVRKLSIPAVMGGYVSGPWYREWSRSSSRGFRTVPLGIGWGDRPIMRCARFGRN